MVILEVDSLHFRMIEWLIHLLYLNHEPKSPHSYLSLQGNITRTLNFSVVVASVFGVIAGNVPHFDHFLVPLWQDLVYPIDISLFTTLQ